METQGLHVDHEAARYRGMALMGTIGATWLLRPTERSGTSTTTCSRLDPEQSSQRW